MPSEQTTRQVMNRGRIMELLGGAGWGADKEAPEEGKMEDNGLTLRDVLLSALA